MSSVGSLGAAQLSANRPIGPSGAMTLTIGDDYLASIGRPIQFEDPLDGSWPATILAANLTVRQAGNDTNTQLNLTGNCTNTSPRVITFEAPHANTSALVPSVSAGDNLYAVTCYCLTSNTGVVTILNDMPATIVKPLAE